MAKMATDTDLKKFKIEAFCTGGIPGFELLLSILNEEAKENEQKDYPPATLDSTIILIQNLKFCNKLLVELIEFYPLWSEERRQCIEQNRTIADKIDQFHRNANKAHLPAAGLGIISGALVITGFALTPVTLGASLGLTAAGAVVGLASAGLGVGTSVSDVVARKEKVKKAHECFEEHKQNTVKLITMVSSIVELAEEIQKLSNDQTVCLLQAVMSRNDGGLAKAAAFGMVSSVKSTFNFIYSIPEAVAGLKHLCLIITTSPMLQGILNIAPSQIGNAVAKINTKGEEAKATAKIGGQAFVYGSALGIAVGTGIAAYTIYDMVKNESKTEAGKKLRELCEQMEQEHSELDELYQALAFALDKDKELYEEPGAAAATITTNSVSATAMLEKQQAAEDKQRVEIVEQLEYEFIETQSDEKCT